jgi:hypothetical protein
VITVRREVRTDRRPDRVAAYLSDFTTTSEWDPHTVSCDRVGEPGPPEVGARYVNVQKVLGRRTAMDYRVVELEPGRRIRLEGSSSGLDATDTMTFEPVPSDGQGTLVVYEATFRFGGALGRLEPLLRPLMGRIADDGARGMRAALRRL